MTKILILKTIKKTIHASYIVIICRMLFRKYLSIISEVLHTLIPLFWIFVLSNYVLVNVLISLFIILLYLEIYIRKTSDKNITTYMLLNYIFIYNYQYWKIRIHQLLLGRKKKSVTLATDIQSHKKSYLYHQEIFKVIVHMAQKLSITTISLESRRDHKHMELLKLS